MVSSRGAPKQSELRPSNWRVDATFGLKKAATNSACLRKCSDPAQLSSPLLTNWPAFVRPRPELGALNRSEYARQAPDRAALIDRLEGMAPDCAGSRFVEALLGRSKKGCADAVLGSSLIASPSRNRMCSVGEDPLPDGPHGGGEDQHGLGAGSGLQRPPWPLDGCFIGADRDRLGTERELLDRAASLGIYTLAAAERRASGPPWQTPAIGAMIVDTAGLGIDPRLSEQAQFISDFPELTAFLVLAASAQRSTLEATIRRYGA